VQVNRLTNQLDDKKPEISFKDRMMSLSPKLKVGLSTKKGNSLLPPSLDHEKITLQSQSDIKHLQENSTLIVEALQTLSQKQNDLHTEFTELREKVKKNSGISKSRMRKVGGSFR